MAAIRNGQVLDPFEGVLIGQVEWDRPVPECPPAGQHCDWPFPACPSWRRARQVRQQPLDHEPEAGPKLQAPRTD